MLQYGQTLSSVVMNARQFGHILRLSITSHCRRAVLNCKNMKGNPKVIVLLNDALREELLAINQYFLHAEMCENWHYMKLANFIKKQSIDEMRHAEKIIERLLFLDGVPAMSDAMKLTIGATVKEQLNSDLKLEISAVEMYNKAAASARQLGDAVSADLFELLLADEEKHVDWLEAQMHLIKEIGYERYLTQQLGENAE